MIKKILTNYFFIRFLRALVTIFVVATFTFFLIRLMPGNPLDIFIATQLSQGVPLQEAQERAASLFHIDLSKPLLVQYVDYLKNLARGDFGVSIISTNTPVSKIILRFLPWTLFVVTVSLFISFVGGVLLGVLMAIYRNSWLDQVLSFFASIISAIPNYVIAMLIVVYFGVKLKWFNIAEIRGSLSPGVRPEFSLYFLKDAFYHAMLPIIVYVLTTIGSWMLVMKSSTISTLGEDYVEVAKARGIKQANIMINYVGRNAILPLFVSLAISIGFVVGGSPLIESIFVYQGIGLKLSDAIVTRDYPVMQAIFLIITASVVFANFLADILLGVLDPRIRTSRG